ncbi:MAG TPA: GtrA family protein [Candidatus Saccharimonadales bacterium]|jgi:putative flippase GtrA|nr:GtrA family protein [Candidatus Saccharimonadales bacterium]
MKNSSQKVRFVAVGGINTLIDFGLLFSLKALGLPAISANVISTTAAFCFSFFANKKYTFKTAGTDIKREIFLFITVTLFGLWVLQTLVIAFVTGILAQTHLQDGIILLIAKLLATVVSLVWNYVLYSRVVFKQP